ncbi:MAG: phosphodiester glycosidase family protein [Deltaproteobacteria bacterium]|nr:phosphodiester glycosidase family protein [Deltaproteobacteria bacterium]
MRQRALKWAVVCLGVWSLGWASLAGAQAPAWRELAPGLAFTLLHEDSPARAGSEHVAVLKVDPRRFRFKVLTGRQNQDGRSAQDWRKDIGALAVFNAGQYAEDQSYLGLLLTDGKLVGHLATRLDGIFLAGPKLASLPPARVLDLRYTTFDPAASPYLEGAQSLMLLDRYGQIRVRRSPKIAHRTAVAEDSQGNILIFVTEGGHTLWEFANFLANQSLGLRDVMCMDGGAESQLSLKAGDFSYEQYGGPSNTPDLPWMPASLPVAVAIFPK